MPEYTDPDFYSVCLNEGGNTESCVRQANMRYGKHFRELGLNSESQFQLKSLVQSCSRNEQCELRVYKNAAAALKARVDAARAAAAEHQAKVAAERAALAEQQAKSVSQQPVTTVAPVAQASEAASSSASVHPIGDAPHAPSPAGETSNSAGPAAVASQAIEANPASSTTTSPMVAQGVDVQSAPTSDNASESAGAEDEAGQLSAKLGLWLGKLLIYGGLLAGIALPFLMPRRAKQVDEVIS
ncbi:hypothetical protein [Inhella gelatinilytica]|uniref:hypothetical protein n=1 Tax=Inhella gelatinilytica TaxID=2795030 RepID=UPI0018DBC292|nr:hypothetical protein [Inhella gelatinilytica]